MPPPSSLTDATAIVTHRCHRHRHSPMPPPSSLAGSFSVLADRTKSSISTPLRLYKLFLLDNLSRCLWCSTLSPI
ncbi:hypothetical protein P8452_50753 [Trifolium repens]|nr:hypothetical protein P8452_50753 [Trifolium repens]